MLKAIDGYYRRYGYFMLFVLVVALYGKSIFFDYTYVDDHIILEVNREFLQHFSNLPKIFTTDFLMTVPNIFVYYRPLVNLLFMVEMQITENVLPLCHCTNILLHLFNSCLLYILLSKMKIPQNASLFLSLAFCVLPINTSAIVWIPGRNDTLMTFFVLCAFISFLEYADTSRWTMLGSYSIFYFLSLLTKETAIVLPILCLVYLLSVEHKAWNSKSIASIIVCSVTALVPWFGLRSLVHQSAALQQQHPQFSGSLAESMSAVVLYCGKNFLPINLTVMPNIIDQSLIYGLLCVLAIAVIVIVRFKKQHRSSLFGLLWFVLFLIPAFLVSNTLYESRAYCSVVGMAVFIGQIVSFDDDHYRKVLRFAAGMILLVFFIITWITEEQYRDRMAYAHEAILHAPSDDESYSILGGAYIDQGQDAAAEKVLTAGIRKKPAMTIVHRMLGDIYVNKGDYTQAAREYETSLRIEPLHLYTYINYGKLCLQTGEYDRAAQLWKTTVAINPEFILGYYYLANFYIHTKINPDSAAMYVREIQNHGAVVMPELLESLDALRNGRK